MSHDHPQLALLAERTGQALQHSALMLATAESCTGGWIAKVITDVAGSSAWFERGFVTYSNAAKQELLGVGAEVLSRHGAVSEATVKAMAQGALAHSRADLAVAVSGIAGPDGGTPDKPVGLVWLAWARRNGVVGTRELHFPGDREAVRAAAVKAALQGILERLV